MRMTSVSTIIALLVLLGAFVLALVGQLTWVLAALIGGLAVAFLLGRAPQ